MTKAKFPKKSIADLIGKTDIDIEDVDKAVAKIHEERDNKNPSKEADGGNEKVQKSQGGEKKASKRKSIPKEEKTSMGKSYRVSVDTPLEIWLQAQRASKEAGDGGLKYYFLKCVEEKLERDGY